MSTNKHQTYLITFAYGVFLIMCVFIGFSESASNYSAGEPTKAVAKDCTVENSSCTNCTAYANCIWCFATSSCYDKSVEKKVDCDEDDWDYGDCDKKEKEAVLLYVLLACAVILLLIVVLLVLYIFFCKMPRNQDYSPLNTADVKKRRSRTPLMSKKFKPVGSRTDELKKKYGLQ